MLLVLAFVASAADFAAHLMTTEMGSLPPAGKVWGFFAPQQYEAFVRSHPSGVWQTVLQMPTWAIFGVPGLVLVVIGRRKKSQEDVDLENSMFLFDELAKHAKEQNYEDFADVEHDGSHDDPEPDSHNDINIAEDHYTENSIVDDVLLDRDYLLGKKHYD